SYEVSGGYQVFRSSSHNICVIPKLDSSSQIIPSEVVEIAWDNSFILAKQQDSSRFNYWILDLKGPTLLGPFADEDFRTKRAELGIFQRAVLRSVEQSR